MREHEDGPVDAQFLAEVDGGVVGYCGVDLGADAEICGMVHPEHRRRGIGGEMLERALRATRAMGRETALVICEDAEPLAIDWLIRRGGTVDSSELRMVTRLSQVPASDRPGAPAVELRPSRAEDREALVRLLTTGFSNMTPEITEQMVSRHQEPGEESLLAWDDGELVGTLRLTQAGERWMIYGVVIDPARRGQGYGGAAVRAALDTVRACGGDEVSLEVEPGNAPAIRLYGGLGFRTSTTYRYVRVRAAH